MRRVAGTERRRRNCNQRAAVDKGLHGVAQWAKGDGFAGLELLDVGCGPAHRLRAFQFFDALAQPCNFSDQAFIGIT